MPAWWDSPDAVTNFNWTLRWIAAAFGALAAICGILIVVSGRRAEELKKKADAPRSLSAEQRQRLIEMISAAPKVQIEIECSYDDREAIQFTSEIISVFNESGWQVIAARGMFPLGSEPQGIDIGALAKEQIPSQEAVALAFEKVGFTVKKSTSENDHPLPMHLVIGKHEPPSSKPR